MIRASILGVLFASCVVVGQAQGQTCAQWAPTSPGSAARIDRFVALPNGDIVAPGGNGLIRWNGSTWSALGGPISTSAGHAIFIAAHPNGGFVAALEKSIYRWDGTWWPASTIPIIPAPSGQYGFFAQALTVRQNGDILVGGFSLTSGALWRWDGTSWSALGIPSGGFVQALATQPNGDVVVAGRFASASGVPLNNIGIWNGSTWAPLAGGIPGTVDVNALVVLPNGHVVAGGWFAAPGTNIARWNGVSWSALGSGVGIAGQPCRALAVLPNGHLVAGGDFTIAGGGNTNGLARWDGAAWSPMAGGVTGANATVWALLAQPHGELHVGGWFTAAGGNPASNYARYVSSCPATATPFGTGCPSSGGANTLTATKLPWIDATFDATATGLPATAIILTVTSVTPWPQGALPLTVVFPQAGPGCDVLVQPDVLGVLVTTTGMARSEFLLPLGSPLVGLPFYHQMVVIDVNGTGDWVAVSATNSLQLVAGDF